MQPIEPTPKSSQPCHLPTRAVEEVGGVGIQNIVAWRRGGRRWHERVPILRVFMDGSGSCQLSREDLPGVSCSCVAEAAVRSGGTMANSGTPKAVLSKGGVDQPNNGGNPSSSRLFAFFRNYLAWADQYFGGIPKRKMANDYANADSL